MLPPIPVLSDYGISPNHGFLPDTLPLSRLPDPYYGRWEAIAANLQALILSKRIRGVIDRLPILSTTGLEHDAEWRRAYSLLCFMAHGYIWGGDSPSDRLPPAISVPLLQISRKLELPPVATYAAVVLWNFKPLFVDEEIDNLENLATLNTFTGSLDESWFYLVSVAIEARGAPILLLMLSAIEAARAGDAATVAQCLRLFAERLDDLGSLLQRMHESCDPTVFYNRIRPYLAGSKGMADAGLPNGVIYEDGSGVETYRKYSGGSNAQSSLIQFFDIVLGVDHRPTGEGRDSTLGSDRTAQTTQQPPLSFIMDMRTYMPGPHARFLHDVSAVANIRDFVESHHDDQQLRISYAACLSMLSALRDKHMNMVTRYIVLPSRARAARPRSRSPEVAKQTVVNLATASRQVQLVTSALPGTAPQAAIAADMHKRRSLKGTGGTALIAFLKQARDETGEPAVDEWAKRFMRRQVRSEGSSDFFRGKPDGGLQAPPDEVPTAGTAGTWAADDEVGGICSY